MRATDVMTPTVISVDPDTTVQDLATLLSERGISGAPVVDAAGRMIGIVSEGDLLHRTELGTEGRTERRHSWWLEHFASGQARDYVKSHGRTVKDIMSAAMSSQSPRRPISPRSRRCLKPTGSSACRSCATARSSASSPGPTWCGRWSHRRPPPPRRGREHRRSRAPHKAASRTGTAAMGRQAVGAGHHRQRRRHPSVVRLG